jgi:hypothetical protein
MMEPYRCLKKNSIIDMMKNPENFNPLLKPCLSLNALDVIMGKRRSHRSLQRENNLLHLELSLGSDTGTHSFFFKRIQY